MFPAQDQITITGYEHKAIAAKEAIQHIVDELEEMISEDITLDSRVHARIIGARGKGIRKIMDEFKVRRPRGQETPYNTKLKHVNIKTYAVSWLVSIFYRLISGFPRVELQTRTSWQSQVALSLWMKPSTTSLTWKKNT